MNKYQPVNACPQTLVSRLTTLLSHCLTTSQVKQVHAQVIIRALHNLDSLLVRQLCLSTYAYSSTTANYIQSILHNSRNLDAFSWGSTVRFLSRHGCFLEAFSFYVEMVRKGVRPSSFAVTSALKACSRILDNISGISIHAQVKKFGFCSCVYVNSALVDLYSKLGDMGNAQKVFDEMATRNVVSWNALLSGYLNDGNLVMARRVFNGIPGKDVVSWNAMVSGYARMGDMEQAVSLFQQMPEKNCASWNALISGYAQCGSMQLARKFFDMMPLKSSVSWLTMITGYSKCGDVNCARELFEMIIEKDILSYNAMISCYAQNGLAMEALELFNEMLNRNGKIPPDKMTLASVISACSQLGDLNSGLQVKTLMEKHGIQMDDRLATALVDLHAKCGNVDKAYELFRGLKNKDIVAYSAMILGCGINGKAEDAIKLFKEMVDAQITPNLITFTGILTAYTHAGMVHEGYQCFKSMKDYRLVPSADHYGIMVDLLGRAGRLEDAHRLIKSMPMQPHTGVWGALLLACTVHNNIELAEVAARHCFEMENDANGYSSLLAGIYASVERWDDAGLLRKAVAEKNVDKIPGYSWLEST